MTAFALDHVFVAGCPDDASVLAGTGLAEGARGAHPGQGTANACFFFENAYLELLWLADPAEARSPAIRRTRLWERCRWRETGASPFGLAFRPADPADPLPFDTWPYRPPYLPAGGQIPVSIGSEEWAEPLLFVVPGSIAPAALPPEGRPPLEHPAGHREITAIRLRLPGAGPGARFLATRTDVTVVRGDDHRMEIEFDHGARGRVHDLGPGLPLAFRW